MELFFITWCSVWMGKIYCANSKLDPCRSRKILLLGCPFIFVKKTIFWWLFTKSIVWYLKSPSRLVVDKFKSCQSNSLYCFKALNRHKSYVTCFLPRWRTLLCHCGQMSFLLLCCGFFDWPAKRRSKEGVPLKAYKTSFSSFQFYFVVLVTACNRPFADLRSVGSVTQRLVRCGGMDPLY